MSNQIHQELGEEDNHMICNGAMCLMVDLSDGELEEINELGGESEIRHSHEDGEWEDDNGEDVVGASDEEGNGEVNDTVSHATSSHVIGQSSTVAKCMPDDKDELANKKKDWTANIKNSILLDFLTAKATSMHWKEEALAAEDSSHRHLQEFTHPPATGATGQQPDELDSPDTVLHNTLSSTPQRLQGSQKCRVSTPPQDDQDDIDAPPAASKGKQKAQCFSQLQG
ncbi:hypothetical protein OG21DRAFT_1488116 [Imleria badia]|nr:hypothetical protein OG21DRAFT_1488116 [Imleria badia]